MTSSATLTCPKCHGAMRTYERNGVHLDQCGECRGIFLDRGELERLIDAEAAYYGDRPSSPAAAPGPSQAPSPSAPQPGHQQPTYQQPAYGASAQAGAHAASSSSSSSDLGRLAGEVLRQVATAKSGSHGSGYGYTGKRKKSFLEQILG